MLTVKTPTYVSAISLSLLLTTPLLELHATHMHDGGSDLVDVGLVLSAESQDVERLLQDKDSC